MSTEVTFPCTAHPYMPHDPPMALLDEILACSDTQIEALVRIRPGIPFYADGGVPNWVGIEYMAQAIGASAGVCAVRAGKEVQIGFLVSTRRANFSLPLYADGMELHVFALEVIIAANGLATFDCRIEAEGEEIATARINVYQPEDAQAYLGAGD